MIGVLFSDAHGDARTSGVRRHDEVVRAFRQVEKVAVERKAKFVGFLGDLGNPENADTYRTLGEMRRMADNLAKGGIAWFGLAGNHDVLESDADGGMSVLSALGHPGVVEKPEITCLPCGGPTTLYLPYTPAWAPYDPEEWARRFLDEVGPRGKGLVFGHLNLAGIHPGSEATSFARGREIFWPLSQLEPHAGRIKMFGGHVHKAQRYRGVEIVGSTLRLDHGEESNRPRILVVDV